jgi:hypothetical protein
MPLRRQVRHDGAPLGYLCQAPSRGQFRGDLKFGRGRYFYSFSAVLCRPPSYQLSGIQTGPWGQKTKERYPATTYSPTPLPGQYHRRWWA